MENVFVESKIKSFRDLRTWQEGRRLFCEVHKITVNFPKEERYVLTSQLHSSALSIPANIAEGMGRGSPKDLIRFLIQARGSLHEVLSHLQLAFDLKYISLEEFNKLEKDYNGLNAGVNSHIESLRSYVK
ncbi:MAG: four helix bundle protein [Candidatus Uhrbacteria bacterium]